MSFFSIIIPTYNRRELLRQALASVWAQTFTDYEVIVVDDGSTDDTEVYLSSLGNRVRVFRQQNCGPGVARNLGAREAKGEYLAFLDSDDLWFPWTLATFASVLNHCSNASPHFLAGKAVEVSLGEPRQGVLTPAAPEALRYNRFEDYLAAKPEPPWIPTDAVVIYRDSFLRSRGFPEQRANAEDSDLWLRLGTQAGFVEIVTPPLVVYRRHKNSETALEHIPLTGVAALIERENRGEYPGGQARRMERTKVIMAHVRPIVVACLREGRLGTAWQLYRKTFRWSLYLRRFRYLLGYWVLFMHAIYARQRHATTPSVKDDTGQ